MSTQEQRDAPAQDGLQGSENASKDATARDGVYLVPHADVPIPGHRRYNGRTFTPFQLASAERGSEAWLAAVHGEPVEGPAADPVKPATAEQSAQRFLADLGRLCDEHGVSLFFGDRFADLWAKGSHIGALADAPQSGGDRFELLATEPDLRSVQVRLPAAVVEEHAQSGRWHHIGGVSSSDGYTAHLLSPEREIFALSHGDRPPGLDRNSDDAAKFNASVVDMTRRIVETLNSEIGRDARNATAARHPAEGVAGDATPYTVEALALLGGHRIKQGEDIVADVQGGHEQARRVAASLNACQDLCVGALERGGIAQMIRSANTVIHSVHSDNRKDLDKLVNGLHDDVTDLVLPDVLANDDEPEGMRP